MLGVDTIVFTRHGFKKLGELKLYDEVLTPFGDFEPIMELGPLEEMKYEVQLSDDEVIYCDDNLLWYMIDAWRHTDELERSDSINGIYLPLIGKAGELGFNPYNYSVVVPNKVPLKIMFGSLREKLGFLAGLIDSPICELGLAEGIYKLYFGKKYKKLAYDVLGFIRSLDIGSTLIYEDGVYIVWFSLTKYIDRVPIRDEMKQCYDYANNSKYVSIKDIKLSKNDKKLGRKIRVNKDLFLIGYGLITVA